MIVKPTYLNVLALHAINVLLLFIPMIIGIPLTFDYNLGLLPSYESRIYEDTLLVTVTVSLLLAFEYFLDYRMDFKVAIPRFTIICALLIPSTLLLFGGTLPHHEKAKLFVCLFEIRNNLVIGALLSALIEIQSSEALKRLTLYVSIFSTVAFNYWLWESFFTHSYISKLISVLFNILFLGAILWLFYVNCTGLQRFFDSGELSVDKLSEEEKFSLIFTLALNLNFFVKFATFFFFNSTSWEDIGPLELMLFSASDVVFGVIAFSTTGRIEINRFHRQQMLLESKKNFVRYISHEVRTPLNIVFMGLQFLTSEASLKENNLSKDTQSLLTESLGACEMAISILNELLLYDKVEDGNLVLEKEAVLVSQFLSEVISPFRAQAAEKQINLRFEDEDHFPPVLLTTGIYVDVSKFSQIIRNLVSNAIKFSPVGNEVHVYASLSQKSRSFQPTVGSVDYREDLQRPSLWDTCCWPSHKQGQRILEGEELREMSQVLRIEVHDNGPGISPSDQEKLFNEIIQFNAAQHQGGGGSGLGLWISAAIAKKHGGAIGVSSNGIPGEGCVFYVEIDTTTLDETSGELTTLSPHALASQDSENRALQLSAFRETQQTSRKGLHSIVSNRSSGPRRVLVVDDSLLNVKMIVRGVRPFFDVVTEAFDGSEAIDIVRESLLPGGVAISIIFMDAIMTKVHGPEAATVMRRMGYTGRIVAVTGNTLQEDIDHFLASGADIFLGKPLQLDRLQEVLEVFELSEYVQQV